MITLWILIAHLFGDYIIQTDWMAQEKTKRWSAALVHGLMYTLPFLLITTSPWALLVIGGTHIVIDRYRLAKHVVWLKNQFQPKRYRPAHTPTGMSEETPDWLAYWLLFIQDNIIHILINVLAVIYL